MKTKALAGLMVAGLLAGGTAFTVFAQNGPGQGRNGCGYGGPPQSQEERAARQAACLERNGGICPNGGPRAEGQGRGNGMGKGLGRGQGQGHGWRHGLRDGTGPRGSQGACPFNNQAAAQK